MPDDVAILGVRHHGPGSARLVGRALDALRPSAVLVEGPPEAVDVLSLAAHEEMRPPVALLVYDLESPRDAAFYPFASFSPEWVAIRWALAAGVTVRLIDAPRSARADDDEPSGDPSARVDPLEAMATAAGFSDGEAWWGRLIEERRGDEDPLAVFDAIRDVMTSLRADSTLPRDRDEEVRESFMRRGIRAAVKEGHERIAVVCGAWHGPALTAAARKERTAKADDECIAGRKASGPARRKVAATWIPWTFGRLAAESGYGAGIASPGWYEHLWLHRGRVSERWMTRVARLMRDEDLDASPASVIESVRMADTLAALRDRAVPSLDDLADATLATLCHGNTAPMRVIERGLVVGERLGAVPSDAPSVPLERDLAAQQKSLRMKVSADSAVLELDQRKETDLARSRLLHRLSVLGVAWGTLRPSETRSAGTFRETWTLQWAPELSVAVIEAARWGNTVADAAAARARDRVRTATSLGELAELLRHVLLSDLVDVVAPLVRRINDIAAVGADMTSLMDAIPTLAQVARYGNVRNADASLVEPLLGGLCVRLCAGLRAACSSLDDDAASAMRRRIDAVHGALATLDRADLRTMWLETLPLVGDDAIHGFVAGRAWRLLLDANAAPADDVARRLSRALSRGNDPAHAAAWIEGMLAGAGAVLVHDERLLGIVDSWIVELRPDAFDAVVPVARRTFATFTAPERRMIGERLRRTVNVAGEETTEADESLDPERVALVQPILRLLLGGPTP